MAITYVAAGTAGTANGAAPALTLPAGLADGDLMVAVFYSRETVDGTVSISAGWNQIVNARSAGGILAAWWRIYQAGDTAPTLTVTGHAGGNSGDSCIGQIAAWSGVDTTTPLDVTGILTTTGATVNIGPIAGISLGADDLVVVVGGKLDDWTSVADLTGDGLTWAEIGEPDNTSGADAGMVWDYAINGASPTTVTSKTFTVTGGTSQAGRGVMFSVNVATAATITGAATLAGDGSLTAAGTREQIAAASLSASTALAAAGTVIPAGVTGAASLAADATLTATGTREQLATAALTAQSTLTATGTVGTTPPGAVLTAASGLTATGSLTRHAAATLTAQAGLAANATATIKAAATLTAAGNLAAAGYATLSGNVALAALATLTATGDIPAPYEPILVTLDGATTASGIDSHSHAGSTLEGTSTSRADIGATLTASSTDGATTATGHLG